MFTQNDLRQVMRRWPSGVAILTASDGLTTHGLSVNSFTSVSIDPEMVTVTLANTTRAKRIVDSTGLFAINLLPETQAELSDVFAGRIPEHADRFAGVETTPGLTQIPLLKAASAHVECRVVHTYEMPHSTLYVAEVLRAEKNADAPPLVYFNREYHRIQ